MRPLLRLENEKKSGAILDDYFLPSPLFQVILFDRVSETEELSKKKYFSRSFKQGIWNRIIATFPVISFVFDLIAPADT